MVYRIPIGIQSSHGKSSAPIFSSTFDDRRSTSMATKIIFFLFSLYLVVWFFVYGVLPTPHRGTEESTTTRGNMYKQKHSDPISHITLPSFKGVPRFIECRRRNSDTNNQLDARYRFLYLLALSYILHIPSDLFSNVSASCSGSIETVFDGWT